MSDADLCEDGPYELERWRRIARMIPPAQLVCLEAADEIIESGLLGPEWKLEQVGQHDITYDQRIVEWRRPMTNGWDGWLSLRPPIKNNVFRCQIGIHYYYDDDHHGGSASLQGPGLCGTTATEAVTGALTELARYFEKYPNVV